MKKLILLAVIVAVAVLMVEVWAQEISLPKGIFSGTITKVDPEGKGFFARNEAGEVFFQWNRNTKISGFPSSEGDLVADILKEGMVVRIFYIEPGMTRVASRIEVKKSDMETWKGWEHPFGCGVSLC
jgi:hypothetical protein